MDSNLKAKTKYITRSLPFEDYQVFIKYTDKNKLIQKPNCFAKIVHAIIELVNQIGMPVMDTIEIYSNATKMTAGNPIILSYFFKSIESSGFFFKLYGIEYNNGVEFSQECRFIRSAIFQLRYLMGFNYFERIILNASYL